jgi:putative addiction module CopG family antidote
MSTVRKTITVTEQQDSWIAQQVRAGRFTNDSELIRDLIRREQERGRELAGQKPAAGHDRWFRAQVQAALDKAGSPKARFHDLDDAATHLRKRARRLAKAG